MDPRKGKDLSRRQAEEFASLFESLQIGEGAYAPEMTTLFGEAVADDPYVPTRDYNVPWQTGKSTDPQPGQEMPTPTGITSTGSFRAPDEGGKTYVGRSMGRDNEWWDAKRPTIGLESAWDAGVDLLLSDDAYTYNSNNPYVYTEEMARAAETAYTPANYGVYDPATDTTFFGGMSYAGDQTQGKTQADYSDEDWNYLQNDRYYEGFDQFTSEGLAALKAAGGTNALRYSHFDFDVNPALDYLRNRDLGYNPFYGDRGRISQSMIDRSRELGHISDELTPYEKRLDGNVMDYLYDAMGSKDQIRNRAEVRRRFEELTGNDSPYNKNMFYGQRMTQGLFNKLGLDEFGLEFDSSYNEAARERSRQAAGSGNTPTMGMLGDNPFGNVKSGSFLDSYLKQRNESKPSVVAGLIQEMKDQE